MFKYLSFLIALLSFLNLKAQDNFTNLKGKTASQLGAIVSGVTVPNKSFFDDQIFQRIATLVATSMARGITPADYNGSINDAWTAAGDSSTYLLVPTDYSSDSTITWISGKAPIIDLRNGTIAITPWVSVYSQNHDSLAPAVTAANGKLLVISDTLSLTGDYTLANPVQIVAGGYIDATSLGDTLTIKSSFDADIVRVFGDSITVQFALGVIDEVYAEWWGADAQEVGSVGDGRAINRAINSGPDGVGINLRLLNGTYTVDETINIHPMAEIYGAGQLFTTLKAANSLNDTLVSNVPNTGQYIRLSDFTINGNRDNNTATTGMYLDRLGISSEIKSILFAGCAGNGLVLNTPDNQIFTDLYINNNDSTGFKMLGGTQCTLINVQSERSPDVDDHNGSGFLIRDSEVINMINCGVEETNIGVEIDSSDQIIVSNFFAYGAASAGSETTAIQISSGSNTYFLTNIFKDSYTNSVVDNNLSVTYTDNVTHTHTVDFNVNQVTVKGGQLNLIDTKLVGNSSGQLAINFNNSETGSFIYYGGGTSELINFSAGSANFQYSTAIDTLRLPVTRPASASNGNTYVSNDTLWVRMGGTWKYIKGN